MADIVYVLTNEAIPDLVKIGRTGSDLARRIAELSSASGVPLPFECYYAAIVPDGNRVEKLLHQLFADQRLNPRREFFRVEPEKVVVALAIGDFPETTPDAPVAAPEEEKALADVKARRPRINLGAIGVQPGAVLTFSRDEAVLATVAEDGRNLMFENELLSPSAAALKVLQRLGYKTPSASGSDYWVYDGELLDERRRRVEAERLAEPVG